MSTTEENKTIARRYVDVWNQHDPAALDTVFAANAVRHDPATGVATGIVPGHHGLANLPKFEIQN